MLQCMDFDGYLGHSKAFLYISSVEFQITETDKIPYFGTNKDSGVPEFDQLCSNSLSTITKKKKPQNPGFLFVFAGLMATINKNYISQMSLQLSEVI